MAEQKTPSSDGSDAQDFESIYIKAARKNQQRYGKLVRFTHSSTRAAGLMLAAAVVALIVANTGGGTAFREFWNTEIIIGMSANEFSLSIGEVINDIFMAIFFLLVGLEIKYEMVCGELTNIRSALLPILAACGGVLAPIVIYSLFNAGNPETAHGWGVPTATDIAFALGIMALLRDYVPNGVRVFLSTLAVADDIIAILVIAIFYGQTPSFFWLGMMLAVTILLVVLNRTHVYSLVPYLLLGCVLWYCTFRSGVHATISGVILAFTIPTGSHIDIKSFVSWSRARMREADAAFDASVPVIGQESYLETVATISKAMRQIVPPALRLDKALYPWVYFFILPLFALTNANVSFVGGELGAMLSSPALWGVFFGLLLGKPIGIMLFSFLTVKLRIASLPTNVNWVHMMGAAILGGVGFTMAIFVANLAFDDAALVTAAKVGILSASLLAGIIGFLFLFFQARIMKKRGQVFVVAKSTQDSLSVADAEAAKEASALLQGVASPLLNEEVHAAGGRVELVLDLGEDGARSDAFPEKAETARDKR